MRYPASGDIISIHTCVISFLTNQLTVFFRAVKHLWFSVVCSFRSFHKSKLSFKLIIKWRQAGLSRSEMRNWSNSQKNKKIRIQRGKHFTTSSYSIISFRHQTLACSSFSNISSRAFTTTSERPHLELEKKMAPTMNPRVSEDFFQASRDILTKTELPLHNFYSDAVLHVYLQT